MHVTILIVLYLFIIAFVMASVGIWNLHKQNKRKERELDALEMGINAKPGTQEISP